MLRRILLSAALIVSLVAPAIAQPAPVPALPDTERRTAYSITSSTCGCAVNFALYGDGTDYQNWVEVFINGVLTNFNDPTKGWTITSPTGPIGSIARPITDARLTFNNPQTGSIQIVGARRPRRTSQFQENQGVAARDLNQVVTDLTAQNREVWDKINDVTGRALISQPGNILGMLPTPGLCASKVLGFDGSGLNPICVPAGSGGGGGGSGFPVAITRAQIPTTHTLGAAAFNLVGYRDANDLGYGAPYTCVGQSSSSTLAIQDADGIWCALNTGTRGPAEVINAGWFGAYADYGWDIPSATVTEPISSGDIAANPWWRGTYAVGTSWDTVALQEAIFASVGRNSTPGHPSWGASCNLQFPYNLELFIPGGDWIINKQLLMQAVCFANITFGGGKAMATLWWSGDQSTAMWLCNSCAYTTFQRPAMRSNIGYSQASAIACLWQFDHFGSPGGLSTQQDTFYDAFISVNFHGRGVCVNPVQGSAGQGDTMTWINPIFVGDMAQTGLELWGQNTLQTTILGGDFQGFAYCGILLAGGTAQLYQSHAENFDFGGGTTAPLLNQFTTSGGDVCVTNGNSNNYIGIRDIRSESDILIRNSGWSNMQIDHAAVIGVTPSGQAWQASTGMLQGNVSGGGTHAHAFMLIGDSGIAGWHPLDANAGTGLTTVTDSTASYTVNQWAGFQLWIVRAGNHYNGPCPIASNTATTITVSACTFGPITDQKYHIGGKSGAVPPNWDAATRGTVHYSTGQNGDGFTTVAGSNVVCYANVAGTTNEWVMIPGADFVTVGGLQTNFPLYAKITGSGAASGNCATLTYTTQLTLDRNANVTVNAVDAFEGAAITDNQLTWIDFSFDVVGHAVTSMNDFSATRGLIGDVGTITNFHSNRDDWLEKPFSVGPPAQNTYVTLQGAVLAAAGSVQGTSSPIDLTQTMNTTSIMTLSNINQDITLNAPLPGTTYSYDFTILIDAAAQRKITFGTNFVSNGPVITPDTGFETAVHFRSYPNQATKKWFEIARSTYGANQPQFLYSAAGTALPSCVAGNKGATAVVSDATAPTFNGTYTSGGAIVVPVLCNGTNWTTH